jgi:hypothetical protein
VVPSEKYKDVPNLADVEERRWSLRLGGIDSTVWLFRVYR